MRALIIGAGVCGPVTAMAMHRAGIETMVYEAYRADCVLLQRLAEAPTADVESNLGSLLSQRPAFAGKVNGDSDTRTDPDADLNRTEPFHPPVEVPHSIRNSA